MAKKTLYCVDTYQEGMRGKLVLGDHCRAETLEEATERANYFWTSGRVLGVIAYEIGAGDEFKDYGEPRVLVRHGETPED